MSKDVLKSKLMAVRDELFKLSEEASKLTFPTKYGEFPDSDLINQIDSARFQVGNAIMRLMNK